MLLVLKWGDNMAENKNIKGSITSFNTYHTDAYMIAVKNGFEGTEAEWLESLRARSTEEAIAAAKRAEEAEKSAKANIESAGASAKAGVKKTADEAIEHIASLAEGAYDIVQTPGNSETQVMSQGAVTKYVPKVKSRNLLNVTWQNALIVDTSGGFRPQTAATFAASPDYIAVIGGANYTFSCAQENVGGLIYISEYSDANETAFIKQTKLGATTPVTIHLDGNCAYVRIHLYAPSAPTSWEELIPENFQMELGKTSTEYVLPVIIDPSAIDYSPAIDLFEINFAQELHNATRVRTSNNLIDPSTASERGVWWYNGVRYSYDQGNDGTKCSASYKVKVKPNTKYYALLYNINNGAPEEFTATYVNVFDKDGIFIYGTSGYPFEFTTPDDADYAVLTYRIYESVDSENIIRIPWLSEKDFNEVGFDEYKENGLADLHKEVEGTRQQLEDASAAAENLSNALGIELFRSKNLFNKNAVSEKGQWVNYITGEREFYPDNPYAADTCASENIPVQAGAKYTYNGGGVYGYTHLYSYAIFTASGKFIAGAAPAYAGNDACVLTMPENAGYIVFNISQNNNADTIQFEFGEEATEYAPYENATMLSRVKIHRDQIVDYEDTEKDHILRLPKQFHLIVGDTFEMFYKGILNAINPESFDFEITFGSGNYGYGYKRKYTWTPTASDVGQHTMTIRVRDNIGDIIDEGSVVLNVVNVPKTPAANKVVLCVGDSLTGNGTWPAEFYRRLVASDGDPVGYGLTNIQFIGENTKNGAGYVSFGGGSFSDYNTENVNGRVYHIIGTFNKTDADQHSIYADTAGNKWKLETITATNIKIVLSSGTAYGLPASGTLTHVSGGSNTASITYTSSELGGGNPFWNETTGKVDFAWYAGNKGVSQIDYCYVLFGWNRTYSTEAEYKAEARVFLDNLLAAYPNCKISLLGIQVPSRDGIGQNYGVSWKYYEKLQHVWNVSKWYEELVKEEAYTGKVEYVNISGQFDTDHNMLTSTVKVNNRNTTTEERQNNGVHPADSGYLQIADAVLRNFVSKI